MLSTKLKLSFCVLCSVNTVRTNMGIKFVNNTIFFLYFFFQDMEGCEFNTKDNQDLGDRQKVSHLAFFFNPKLNHAS